MALKKIIKRDGRTVEFDKSKIENVLQKASQATGEFGKKELVRLTNEVLKILQKRFPKDEDKVLQVEDVQDTVEYILVREDHYKTAKAFILYREKRSRIREARRALGVQDDLGLPLNTLKVMERRYLLHDEVGRVIETPSQMFRRVAKAIAKPESKFTRSKKKIKKWEDEFYREMVSMQFLPGGRVLNNAGTKSGVLANCFVLPVEDNMDGIFSAVKWGALVHKAGGGTGYNFSKLRPQGAFVRASLGFASGPVTFMEAFDAMCNVVAYGGKKRGAMMGMLDVSHPDIIDFVTSKQNGGFKNFNISVGASDKFMRAVERDRMFPLIDPRTCRVVHKIRAMDLMNLIASNAWKRGDPGVVFLDELQRGNSLKGHEVIEAVNVCGEIPLPPFDACNLGSINLDKFVKKKKQTGRGDCEVDWDGLENTVKIAVRFLDNVIDASKFPIRQITKSVREHRRLGLGVMGFADMLLRLRIPYASTAGTKFAEKLMKFIRNKAHEESARLAEERGVFPLWDKSEFAKAKKKMRNCAITTVAPTGTISMIPEVTGGIEPIYALAYTKHVVDETGLFYINKIFEDVAREKGFYSEKIIEGVARQGRLQKVRNSSIPKWVKDVFVTAFDIDPIWHVRMQAAFQKYVDNSVSKTINLPKRATINDVFQVYMQAWKLGCKGITVYRDGSLDQQILTTGKGDGERKANEVQSTMKVVPLIKRKFKI